MLESEEMLEQWEPDKRTIMLEQRVYQGEIDVQAVQPLLGNPNIVAGEEVQTDVK